MLWSERAIVTAYSLLSMFALVVALICVRRWRRLLERERRVDKLCRVLSEGTEGEETISRLMAAVAEIIQSDGYYLYLPDARLARLRLAATKSVWVGGEVAPRYSGLAAYRHRPYEPPLGLEPAELPSEIQRTLQGGYAFVAVPLGRDPRIGMFMIGPYHPRRDLRREVQLAREIAPLVRGIILAWYRAARYRDKARQEEALSRASADALRTALDPTGIVRAMLQLGVEMTNAAGGAVVFRDQEGTVQPAATVGEAGSVAVQWFRTQGAMAEVVAGSGEPVPWENRWVTALSVAARRGSGGWLVLVHDHRPRISSHARAALELIAARAAVGLEGIQWYRRVAEDYLDALRALVELMDMREPATRGHSRRIARFAGWIAEELGLPPAEVEAVRTAALLHDVGMFILEEEVLYKSGRYTDDEYERMKRHSQVGAVLLEPVSTRLDLARAVRHHHERYDGWGYPDGLAGEEIPLSARIIAVADTFNAKISPRSYRNPVPYGQAVAELEKVAGSQLDPRATRALLRVLHRRRQAARPDRWLEPCWVFKCLDDSVCGDCPARRGTDNCWEVPGVLCDSHADNCRHCVVFTEYEDRRAARGDGN